MLLVAKNIISDSNLFFYLYNFSQSTTFEYNSNIINKFSFLIFIFFLDILCYGQGNVTVLQDKNTNGSLLKLNIIKDKKVIQKIEYHYPEEYFGNSIYVEEPFEITDVNFDGFDDILIYLGSYGNRKRQFSRIIQN